MVARDAVVEEEAENDAQLLAARVLERQEAGRDGLRRDLGDVDYCSGVGLVVPASAGCVARRPSQKRLLGIIGRITRWKDRSRANANTSNELRRIKGSQVAVAEGQSQEADDVYERKELKRARAAEAPGQPHDAR